MTAFIVEYKIAPGFKGRAALKERAALLRGTIENFSTRAGVPIEIGESHWLTTSVDIEAHFTVAAALARATGLKVRTPDGFAPEAIPLPGQAP